MATTNSLRPLAEQTAKFTPNDVNIWSHRVVDRALIECRELMEEALRGLEAVPPVETDLSTLEAGKKKLASMAAQLNIPRKMVDAEIAKLNDTYVTAKTEARNAHPETGEAGKEITRAITNLYAVSQAYAALITDAIVPYLPKTQAKKHAPNDSDTGDMDVDLAPLRAPQEGDTGDAAGAEQSDADGIDITVGNADDPLEGKDLDDWIKAALEDDDQTIPPSKPAPAPKPAAAIAKPAPPKK
jgi:hypothetical protein